MKRAIIGISTAILAFVLLFMFWFKEYPFGNFDTLNGAKSASWLPGEATDIYSRNNGAFEVYEFKISESGFLGWAKDKGIAVAPITEKKRIFRFGNFDTSSNLLDPGSASKEELESDQARRYAFAEKGYYGAVHNANGSGYEVMFDASSNRAYYWWALR